MQVVWNIIRVKFNLDVHENNLRGEYGLDYDYDYVHYYDYDHDAYDLNAFFFIIIYDDLLIL
jgi:hypothetical protein